MLPGEVTTTDFTGQGKVEMMVAADVRRL